MPKIIIHEYERTAQYFIEDLGNNVTLDMVSIPDGTFQMGTDDEEIERLCKEYDVDYFRRESPRHSVTVQPFFMGKYLVTQAQWKAIAERTDLKVKIDLESDPSHFKKDPASEKGEKAGNRWNRPVECVSWKDAVEFCDRLSRHTKRQYRLPSEAEWEYACRAGTTTPFHFGETITTNLANYQGTDNEEYKWSGSYGSGPKGVYREETTAVGSFGVANNFGLYDMHGNVWEWCQDDWHSDYEGAPTDGSAWLSSEESSDRKLLRGGSWSFNPVACRSAYRLNYALDYDFDNIGFRVVCSGAART
jgi:formylglycine-generating enzyme required for sulfatase activity